MSPRARKPENKGFPTGWRWKGKRLYYMVPKGQEHQWDGKTEFSLGGSVAEAYQVWGDRIGQGSRGTLRTMDQLCEQYGQEHVPTLAPKTQESYRLALGRIRAVFAKVQVQDVTQQHARTFYNKLKADKGLSTARSTCGTLKHLMTMAAEWGVIPNNPLLGMRFAGAAAAKRFLTRKEIAGILSLKPTTRTQTVGLVYVKLALITGLRRGDVLSLKVSDCKDDGIHVEPSKTKDTSGITGVFEWSDELRSAVDEALAIPPRRIGDAPLIVTRQGNSYLGDDKRANGFDSVSRRFIDETVKQKLVESRWTMKDLRAAVASHADSTADAQHQLMHSSPAVTQKHYRRAPMRIQPASLSRFND